MTNWLWATAMVVLAVAVSGTVTWYGQRAGRAVPTAFRQLFAAVEEGRTFMGLPVILGVARTNRWVLVIVVFAAAPSIAAVVLALLGAPVDLVDALRPWNGDSTRALATYAVIAAVFAVGCLWYLGVTRSEVARGRVETPPLLRGRSRIDIAGRLAGGAFVDEGGLLEELGWRAFLLPVLLLELDRGPATLAVAVLWWAWHLPREVPTLRRLESRRVWAQNQLIFVGTCVGLSVLCTEAVAHTGGSVWPAVLIHGGTNVWSKALGTATYVRYRTDVRTIIVVVLAIVVAATWVA